MTREYQHIDIAIALCRVFHYYRRMGDHLRSIDHQVGPDRVGKPCQLVNWGQ